jgi:hypothetical protein
MSRFIPAGQALLIGIVLGATSGCGTSTSSPAANEELFHHGSLGEVGSLYQSYIVDKSKPPTKLADLVTYEVGMPTGYKELKEGNVVILYGAPISDSDVDKVLAYEKATPDAGGYALMADGKTIKKFTAEEFKSAPKAAGKASTSK